MKEKIIQLHIEKMVFWSTLAMLVASISIYIFLINSIVHNAVTVENINTEASQLTLVIGNSEFQYIEKRNEVTIELAYTKGFKDLVEKTFVSAEKGKVLPSVLARRN